MFRNYCNSILFCPNSDTSQKYVGKTRRKHESKFDHNPLPPLNLPNAVLKITNLPKFDITDTFTFSKPLLLENLEQNVTEEDGDESDAVSGAAKNDSRSQTSQNASINIRPSTSDDCKPTPFSQMSESPTLNRKKVSTVKSTVTMPQFSVKPGSTESDSCASKSSPVNPLKRAAPPWTCTVCLLESTGERCSSCTSVRPEKRKSTDFPKPPVPKIESTPSKTLTSGWGDKFKPASDTWECKECFVRNAVADSKCVACASPKPGASIPPVVTTSSSNELWTNVQKPGTNVWSLGVPAKDAINTLEKTNEPPQPKFSFGVDKVDGTSTSTANPFKLNTDSKITTNVSFGIDATSSVTSSAMTTKPTYTFGITSTSLSTPSSTVSTVSTSSDFPVANNVPSFSFGDPNAKTAPAVTSTTNSVPTFSFGNPNPKTAPAVTFSFGANKTSDTTDSGTGNPLTDGVSPKNEIEKKRTNVFNDVSSVTSNTQNPLLKTTADTTSTNDASPFKSPKMTSMFETASANKENGDDKSVGNILFNSIGSSNAESFSKKKNILFPSYSSPSSVPSLFGSNGFVKPEMSSPLTNSNSTSVVSSSVTNVFSNSFSSPTSSKPCNEIPKVPAFGVVPNKIDSVIANDSDKNAKLFASTNSFSAPSTQQQQLSSNSVFGSFGGTKLESQSSTAPTFNATPAFNFGSTNSTAPQSQPITGNQQPASGGFSFNGPKADDTGSSKFVFGSMTNSNLSTVNAPQFTNANFPTNSSLAPANAPQFTNTNFTTSSGFTGAAAPQFGFNAPSVTDQSKPMNSIFASPTPAMKDFQTNSNSIPTFGSSVFGNTNQSTPMMNPMKKPGGFSFPTPSQFGSPTVNNFPSFGNATTDNQVR